MQLEAVKKGEKLVNNLMCIYIAGVGFSGFAFVMLFLNGGLRECFFPISCALALLTKALEKQLGSATKYVYGLIPPIIGAITVAISCTDASEGYVCITHYYFVTTLLLVPYYDQKLLRVNAITTLVVNLVVMILFPAGFLKLHSIIGWIFTTIVYIVFVAACMFIGYNALKLFGTVEEQGRESENVLLDVQQAFDNLQASSEEIFSSIQEFEGTTEEISASTQEISGNANNQIHEVESSLSIFNNLNEKIELSEESVGQTVHHMKNLKEKNDEGIVSIQELSQKFEENIETTQIAVRSMSELSQKSNAIGGIIESIRDIAQQTNLLALNAAIEAARAGEAGKGFAVVAGEINSLSAESSNATSKIDAILKDIIETMENTQKVMEQNSTVVNESSEKLEDTVQIFQNILVSSEEVITVTGRLKGELAEILQIKEQLLGAMERVKEISETSAVITGEIGTATKHQVAGLDDIVRSMENVQAGMEKLSRVLQKV